MLNSYQGAVVSAVLAGLQQQVKRAVEFGARCGMVSNGLCNACFLSRLLRSQLDFANSFLRFRQRLAFTGVAKVKCVIAISGAKIQAPVAAARAFNSKIMCPSLHFIGKSFILSVCREQRSADSWFCTILPVDFSVL